MRLLVATWLVVASGVLVASAALSSSFAALLAAAALAVGCGGSAVRIAHTETLQTRREAARDRAGQAHAHAQLEARRTAEHQALADTLLHQLVGAHSASRELEGALKAETRRAELAESHLMAAARRAEDADQRAAGAMVAVAELEHEVDDLRAEVLAWGRSALAPLIRQA